MTLPQAKACDERLREVREENVKLAHDLLAQQAAYDAVDARCAEGFAGVEERRRALEAVAGERSEILKRRAPEVTAAALAARAEGADEAAEEILQEALSASGVIDA